MKNIPLLVLAGGFGTRLQSVVSDVPKPLAPVHGKPFLSFLLNNWQQAGVRDFVFLLHHKADLIETYLTQTFATPEFAQCNFKIVVEPEPLGTGGSIANALNKIRFIGDFIAVNADTWLPDGMEMMLSAPAPSMAITHVANCNRYGKVVSQNSVITAFEEKKPQSESGWINAGLYRLNSQLLESWTEGAMSLEATILPNLVKSGKMRAVQCDCDFIDIGVPEDYEYFQEMIAAQG
jgi:D-glycero-alpha-D-manno-heptose 1-phosphate guanylyltransferase